MFGLARRSDEASGQMARRSSSLSGSSLRGSSSSQSSSSSNSSSSSASASRSTSASVPEPSRNRPSSKPCFSSRASRNRRARPFLGTWSPALQEQRNRHFTGGRSPGCVPSFCRSRSRGACSSQGYNILPERPIPVTVEMYHFGHWLPGRRAVFPLRPPHRDHRHGCHAGREAEGAAGEGGRPERQRGEGGAQADGPGGEEEVL